MALTNIETTIILDLYDHDTTPSTIKAIQLDSNTRYVAAVIRNKGGIYDIGENTTVTLTVIRPDKVGVQITGFPRAQSETTPDEQVITTYGAYAELSQAALAVKGTLRAQFMFTSGDQILRTEIFTINNGEALDASTDTWAGEYQGYNLDELVQNVNESSAKVDAMEEDVSDLKEGLSAMSTATSSDVGKALKVKTVTDGKVSEWEFGEAGGVTVETDTTLTESGVPADAKATGDAVDAIKSSVETSEALTVNTASLNNYRYKYGTGIEYNAQRRICSCTVTGYDYVDIASDYTCGDETNLYPNIIFFSGTPSTSTELSAVYLGDISQTGWSTRQAVPTGATVMYFVTIKANTDVTVNGINNVGGRVAINEADIASLNARTIFNVTNDGYTYYKNVLHAENIYTSATEYEGSSTSGDGRIKYKNTSPFANPSSQHVVYFGAWVKSTANATAYVLIHNNIPVNISEDYDSGNAELSYKLSKICISKKEIVADTWTFVGGTILTNGGGSNSTNNAVCICCCYADATTESWATMTIKEGVFIDLTNAFGEGCEPTFDGMKLLLSGATDYFITTEYNIFNAPILKGVFERASKIVGKYNLTPSVEVDSTEQQIKMNSVVNPAWSGWTHPQYSYAMNKNLALVNANIHGGLETDAYFSVVPIWGPWTENGANTSCIWGGHIFHGWNSAMTYRLTMMASGNMSDLSDPNYVPREDEFCIQVFSPSSCYDNPVGLTTEQANDRVTREDADKLKGSHYYGRIRIGSDDAKMGFVFRARSLTCYGDIDMNGKKLILGTQNAPTSASASGKAGQISYDSDYMYICVADNTWKRIPLQTW